MKIPTSVLDFQSQYLSYLSPPAQVSCTVASYLESGIFLATWYLPGDFETSLIRYS